MSFSQLRAAAVTTDLMPEENGDLGHGGVFWRTTNDNRLERIVASGRTDVTIDQDLAWTKAFITQYEKIKRTLWQKLRRIEIDEAIIDPSGDECLPVGSKEEGYIIWSTGSVESFLEQVRQRLLETADIEQIGAQLAFVRNGIPQKLTGEYDKLHRNAIFISPEEALTRIRSGLDTVFEYLRRPDAQIAPVDEDRLLALQQFWQQEVCCSLVDGDGQYQIPVQSKGKPLMLVYPYYHEHFSDSTSAFKVSTRPDDHVMIMRAGNMSPLWYGITAVHELSHLHDVTYDKTAENPTKEKYIDGEYAAYSVQAAVVQMLSAGKFEEALAEASEFFTLAPVEVGMMLEGVNSGRSHAIEASINRHVGFANAMSTFETSTRAGFYSMCMGFKSIKKHFGHIVDTEKAKRAFIEIVYSVRNRLPKE